MCFMKWNLLCYCLVLPFLLFACQNSQEKGSLTLKVVDEITFETDSLVPINPGHIQFLETDSGSQIFIYNYFKKYTSFIPILKGNC